jgi:ubiquinone/menaquinone biosynthesis C-methylase UbiE
MTVRNSIGSSMMLELACGPGVWTGTLLRYAADVTAVDGSPEMRALAAARAGRSLMEPHTGS